MSRIVIPPIGPFVTQSIVPIILPNSSSSTIRPISPIAPIILPNSSSSVIRPIVPINPIILPNSSSSTIRPVSPSILPSVRPITTYRAPFSETYETFVKKSNALGQIVPFDSIFEIELALITRIQEINRQYPDLISVVASKADEAPDVAGLDAMTLDQVWKILKATPEGQNIDERFHDMNYIDNLRYFYRKIRAGHYAIPVETPTVMMPHMEQPSSPIRASSVRVDPIDYNRIYSYPTLFRLWLAKTGNPAAPKGLTRIRQALHQYDMSHPEASGINLTSYLKANDIYADMYRMDDLKKLLQDKHRADGNKSYIRYESSLEGLREQLRMYDINHQGSSGSQLGSVMITPSDQIAQTSNYDALVSLYEMTLQSLGRQLEYVPFDIDELRQAIRDASEMSQASSSTEFKPEDTDKVKWNLDVYSSHLSPELVDAVVDNYDTDPGYLGLLDARLFHVGWDESITDPQRMDQEKRYFNIAIDSIRDMLDNGNTELAKQTLNTMVKSKLDYLSRFNYKNIPQNINRTYWTDIVTEEILENPNFSLDEFISFLRSRSFHGSIIERSIPDVRRYAQTRNRVELFKTLNTIVDTLIGNSFIRNNFPDHLPGPVPYYEHERRQPIAM